MNTIGPTNYIFLTMNYVLPKISKKKTQKQALKEGKKNEQKAKSWVRSLGDMKIGVENYEKTLAAGENKLLEKKIAKQTKKL